MDVHRNFFFSLQTVVYISFVENHQTTNKSFFLNYSIAEFEFNLLLLLLLFCGSLMFDRDSGHKTFLEDVFENEARMIPGGNWGQASSPWANVVC